MKNKDSSPTSYQDVIQFIETKNNHWTHTARLLIIAKKSKSYLTDSPSSPNLSSWITRISEEGSINKANLWRMLASGEYLMKVKGYDDVDLIIGNQSTPLAIEIIKKIANGDMEIAKELIEKSEQKKITREQLRKKWVAIRDGKNSSTSKRGINSLEITFKEHALSGIKEHTKLNFKSGFNDFCIQSSLLNKPLILDFITAIPSQTRIDFTGFEFIASNCMPAIDKWNNYAKYCNYFYLVTTRENESVIISSRIDPNIGIIVIDEYNNPIILKDAELNKIDVYTQGAINEAYLFRILETQ